jgi:single-stranded DNA-binding protein
MTEASVSFAGNLTEDPEIRYTESGIARAMFRMAVSGRWEQEASFFTVIVWRDPGRACRPVAGQGQPGGGRGPAPAAGLDR